MTNGQRLKVLTYYLSADEHNDLESGGRVVSTRRIELETIVPRVCRRGR